MDPMVDISNYNTTGQAMRFLIAHGLPSRQVCDTCGSISRLVLIERRPRSKVPIKEEPRWDHDYEGSNIPVLEPGEYCEAQNPKRLYYKCSGKVRHVRSIFKGTPFASSNLSLKQWIFVIVCIIKGWPTSVAEIVKVNRNVISAYRHRTELVFQQCLRNRGEMIGGPGVVVELGQTVIDKGTSSSSGQQQGNLDFANLDENCSAPSKLLGGIEKQNRTNFFITILVDQSPIGLKDAIETFVRPGSILCTDGTELYPEIANQLSMSHRVINFSQGMNINMLQNMWSVVKGEIARRSGVMLGGMEQFLTEWCFRKKFVTTRNNRQDSIAGAFDVFIQTLFERDYELPQ